MTGVTPEGKAYSQFWPTEEHAKDFAKVFLVAAGKMSPSKLSKDMGEGISSAGGVLVPDELQKGSHRPDAPIREVLRQRPAVSDRRRFHYGPPGHFGSDDLLSRRRDWHNQIRAEI